MSNETHKAIENVDKAIRKVAVKYASGEWSIKQNGKKMVHSEYYPIALTGFEEGVNWLLNSALSQEKVIELIKAVGVDDPRDGGLIIVCDDLEDIANEIIQHIKDSL